ncbi:PREDICTED: putative odorant receptor 92a [Ceratosolen solmsi marchali]|uniref:Odorant receptor n=1 Tax=Ceratosolen solmsi marchali TaxID=326594 RepID=A0AAJ6YHI1_9HYME|nr:PREDICTED: putative odorant receptor 92a [Ceratosolen solmsi marchali]
MDILTSKYYFRCNKFLRFCGHWPYQKPIIKILNQTLLMITILTIFIPQMIKMFEMRHDFQGFILSIPSFLYYGNFIFKNIFATILRKEIKKVLEQINYDFKVLYDKDLKILDKYYKKAYDINTYYIVYMLVAVFFYSMLPFTLHTMDIVFPKNESRLPQSPRLIKYYINIFDDNIYFITFHGFLCDTLSIIFLLGFDTLYFTFVYHACALFVIVTTNLHDSIIMVNQCANIESKEHHKKKEELFKQKFFKCIILHKYTLEFVDKLQSGFSNLNIFSIVCAMIPLTITGFEAILYNKNLSQMVRFIFFAVAEIIHLFYYNWPGEKIQEHSLLVYKACYNCKWYENSISNKYKRLLSFMILRSQKPCLLTAGTIYILNMENFSAVIKVSVSYFTVLSSLMSP